MSDKGRVDSDLEDAPADQDRQPTEKTMSTRLTNDIREAITKAALAHRFADDVKALIDAKAEFATSVWEDLYKKADRQKMAELPEGWLPEPEHIAVQFGQGFARVYFNGYTYGQIAQATDYRREDTKRVMSKHKGGCAKVYEASHPLSTKHAEIEAKERDLREAYELAKRQTGAALSSVTTIKRLIETWPEIAPFAERYETEKPSLPALPTQQLNKILDLPVAEAA